MHQSKKIGKSGSFLEALILILVTCSYTRWMLCHTAKNSEKITWDGRFRIGDRVRKVLQFFRKILRDFNCYRMRAEEGIVYGRNNEVEVFTDVSDKQVGEARFVWEVLDIDYLFKALLSEGERKRAILLGNCEY